MGWAGLFSEGPNTTTWPTWSGHPQRRITFPHTKKLDNSIYQKKKKKSNRRANPGDEEHYPGVF
jgi:hypothetical protein